MFRVVLQLPAFELFGLQALDFRRLHGLPDGTNVWLISNGCQAGQQSARVDVPEAFARAWFGQQQVTAEVTIRVELLTRGDLRMACEGNGRAITFADLSPERVQQLYVATRFATLQEQLERAQAD